MTEKKVKSSEVSIIAECKMNVDVTSDKDFMEFKVKLEEEWAKHPELDIDNYSRMSYLLETKALADLTFLVGQDKTEVRAHRFILRDKSEFFNALLSDRWNGQNKDVIEIPEIEDPVDFETFLHFLYCGRTTLNIENALPLLYLSRVYHVPRLSTKAVKFLMDKMGEDIAIHVFKSVSSFDDNDAKRLTEASLGFICKNAIKMFERPDFIDLRHTDLNLIMEAKILQHPYELQIFNSCFRWAVAACKQQGMEQTVENYRDVLGEVFEKIRFPLIGKECFDSNFNPKGILSDYERDALISYWKTRSDYGTPGIAEEKLAVESYFMIRPRNTTIFSVNRFQRFESSTKSWTYSSRPKADRISFKANTSALIHGIGLYGRADDIRATRTATNYVDYNVDVQIYSHNRYETRYGEVSYVQKLVESSSVYNGHIFNVMFKTPLVIVSGMWYTLSAMIKGGDRSYHGNFGQAMVSLKCQEYPVIFEFQEAMDRKSTDFRCQIPLSNGTGVKKGQIPIIYFSIEDEDDSEIMVIP